MHTGHQRLFHFLRQLNCNKKSHILFSSNKFKFLEHLTKTQRPNAAPLIKDGIAWLRQYRTFLPIFAQELPPAVKFPGIDIHLTGAILPGSHSCTAFTLTFNVLAIFSSHIPISERFPAVSFWKASFPFSIPSL